jgi:hypothetical protein
MPTNKPETATSKMVNTPTEKTCPISRRGRLARYPVPERICTRNKWPRPNFRNAFRVSCPSLCNKPSMAFDMESRKFIDLQGNGDRASA